MSEFVIFCDGLCEPRNPGGTACYGFLIRCTGEIVHQGRGVVGSGPAMTNNVAEYQAALAALRLLLDNGHAGAAIAVHSDSKLLVEQLAGRWQVNAPRIIPLWREARRLLANFSYWIVRWVPREQNEEADALSRLAYKEATGKEPPRRGT